MTERLGWPGDEPSDRTLRLMAQSRLVDSLVWARTFNRPGILAGYNHDVFMHAWGSMRRERSDCPRTEVHEALLTVSGIVLAHAWCHGPIDLPTTQGLFEMAGFPEQKVVGLLAETAKKQAETKEQSGAKELSVLVYDPDPWTTYMTGGSEVRTLEDVGNLERPWGTDVFDLAAWERTEILRTLLVVEGHRVGNYEYLKGVKAEHERLLESPNS